MMFLTFVGRALRSTGVLFGTSQKTFSHRSKLRLYVPCIPLLEDVEDVLPGRHDSLIRLASFLPLLIFQKLPN